MTQNTAYLSLTEVVCEFKKHENRQLHWSDKWVEAKDRYENLKDHADKVKADQMIKNIELPQWKCEAYANASEEYQSALEMKRIASKEMNKAKMGFEVACNAGAYYRSICSTSKAEMQL